MTMIETTMSFDEIVAAGMELTDDRAVYQGKFYPTDFDAFGINFTFCPEHGFYHAYYGDSFPLVDMGPDDILNLASYMTKKPKGMTFGDAVEALKSGRAVSRKGWNGKGMYLYMVAAGRYNPVSMTAHVIASEQEDGKVPYLPYIVMKTVTGDVVPWLASQTDVLAEDWELAELMQDATIEMKSSDGPVFKFVIVGLDNDEG